MYATIGGIALEIIGAGFLVLASWNARQALKGFPAPLTYDNYIAALERLVALNSAQFSDQLKGFVLLALGLALQLYGSIKGV